MDVTWLAFYAGALLFGVLGYRLEDDFDQRGLAVISIGASLACLGCAVTALFQG